MKFLTPFHLLLLVSITGCSVGPSYVPPCTEIPDNWKNTNETCESCNNNHPQQFTYLDFWWEIFDDPKLNELEAIALENNRDLYVAFERTREARALMGIAAADFYPQITLNPVYTSTGELIKNYTNNSFLPNAPDPVPFRVHELYYYLPLNLSYEVDLWGKINDRYLAAKFSWLAQKKDYETTMLSLTSNLAFSYYQLRTADKQLDLLQKVLKTRQKSYEINLDRYEGQIAFYSDVALAAEEIGNVQVQSDEILRQRKVLENQIAVLIGVPASEFCLEHNPLEGLPPCIPEGLPSELLLRRPDIASAEFGTWSAHERVKASYAEFFPSLTLTGTGGFESPLLKQFLQWISRFWMVGAQANQIAFDGFRTTYDLDYQIARFNEASGEYQQQVIVAFQDVENALVNLDQYAKEYNTGVTTTQWAEKAYKIYLDRYLLGVINYIDVVNTERDLLNYEITVNALQGYRFLSTIQLIKALGGGWSEE